VYDVVIIGAGLIGMAASYYLAKARKSVALVNSHNPSHTEGSHHGETRLIRHAYGEGEKYVPIALRSQELWHELEEETGFNVFENTGIFNIGTRNSAFIQNVIQSVNTFTLDTKVLIAREINEKWPGFQLPDHLMGCFERNSGILFSEKASNCGFS